MADCLLAKSVQFVTALLRVTQRSLCNTTDKPVDNAIDCVANATTTKAQLMLDSRSQVSICMCASDDVIAKGSAKSFVA